MTVFIVFFLKCDRNIAVLVLHLSNHSVSLLELFFDYFKLLWIGKSVLRPDDFFQLVSQSGTFLHVDFDLNFNLLLPCTTNVPLECLDLINTPGVLVLRFLHLALQIDHEVSISFKSATKAVT